MSRCYALNFGWSQPLSIPQLVTHLHDDQTFNAEIVRQSSPREMVINFNNSTYIDSNSLQISPIPFLKPFFGCDSTPRSPNVSMFFRLSVTLAAAVLQLTTSVLQ